MELREAKEFLNNRGYELIDEGLMDRVKDTLKLNAWDKAGKFEENTKNLITKVNKKRIDSMEDVVSMNASNKVLDQGILKSRFKINDDKDEWIHVRISPVITSSYGKEQTDDDVYKALEHYAKELNADVSDLETRYYSVKKIANEDKMVPVIIAYNNVKGKTFWKITYPRENVINDFLDKLEASIKKEFEYEIKDEYALKWNKNRFTL